MSKTDTQKKAPRVAALGALILGLLVGQVLVNPFAQEMTNNPCYDSHCKCKYVFQNVHLLHFGRADSSNIISQILRKSNRLHKKDLRRIFPGGLLSFVGIYTALKWA